MPRRAKATGFQTTRFPNVHRRGDTLYYRFTAASGKRQEVRFGQGEARDAARAQQAAQEKADAERNGLTDPRQERMIEYGNRSVGEVVDEYTEHLEHVKHDSAGHVRNVRAFMGDCLKACSIKRLLDFEPQRVNRWLMDHDWSAATRNQARQAVLGLTRWAFEFGKIPYNPLPSALIPKADENADRRRLSRAMTVDEFWQLIRFMQDPPCEGVGLNRFRAEGPTRAVFYLVAANTGLRWREIARLTWGMIDLESGTIDVPAGQTKNKRRAELPLVAVVVDALATLRSAGASPSAHVFPKEPRLRTWKADLVRAGIVTRLENGDLLNYRDERGRQIDRKCLRMTFATWLKDAGVDLRDAQRLMRHHSPDLTANIYTDIRLTNLKAAVDRIAVPAEPKRMEPRATGTEG